MPVNHKDHFSSSLTDRINKEGGLNQSTTDSQMEVEITALGPACQVVY